MTNLETLALQLCDQLDHPGVLCKLPQPTRLEVSRLVDAIRSCKEIETGKPKKRMRYPLPWRGN